jgi:hypothetical protein
MNQPVPVTAMSNLSSLPEVPNNGDRASIGSRLMVGLAGLICVGMGLYFFLNPPDQCWWLAKSSGVFLVVAGIICAYAALAGRRSDLGNASPKATAGEAVTDTVASLISRLF